MSSSKKLLLFVVAALVMGSVFAGCGSSSDDTSTTTAGSDLPVVVTPTKLSTEVSNSDIPVYWAGARGGSQYEFTHLEDGRYYVRYLDDGAKAGDPRNTFLTIGTYPVADGIKALQAAAKTSPGTKLVKNATGATMLISTVTPTSVYLAYPGVKAQVEVYDANPRTALEVANSGVVQPVP